MHQSHDFNGVPDSVLKDCLNTWPIGTVGAYEENLMIAILNNLCKRFGYGAVPSMAQRIEDVWRNPEKVAEYKKQMDERRMFMQRTLDEVTKDA